MKLGEVVVIHSCVLQFHQVSLKSDEKQKSFNYRPFECFLDSTVVLTPLDVFL